MNTLGDGPKARQKGGRIEKGALRKCLAAAPTMVCSKRERERERDPLS